jgi:hypothetical protein
VRIERSEGRRNSSPIVAAKPGFDKTCNYLGRSVVDPQKRIGWVLGTESATG